MKTGFVEYGRKYGRKRTYFLSEDRKAKWLNCDDNNIPITLLNAIRIEQMSFRTGLEILKYIYWMALSNW